MTDTDLLTDDEALREQALTEGPRRVGNHTLRPVTAMTMSWLRRNRVFTDEAFDEIFRIAAYAYLHTAPKKDIRAVVNDRAAFIDAVDAWLEKNAPQHHSTLEPFAEAMAQAIDMYSASSTMAKNPSPESPAEKN